MQEALGLKVSQFVSLMGDGPGDRDAALRGAKDARQRVRELVEALMEEAGTTPVQGR